MHVIGTRAAPAEPGEREREQPADHLGLGAPLALDDPLDGLGLARLDQHVAADEVALLCRCLRGLPATRRQARHGSERICLGIYECNGAGRGMLAQGSPG